MQATIDISKALTIVGWMSPGELSWLASRALESNYIVEFGSFHGRSTRALGDNCSGRVWAVDPWDGDYPSQSDEPIQFIDTFCYPQFQANLSDLIASKRVVPHRGFSYSFHLPYQVDMVFIDGDHR
jgi:Methyltransferase domain